MGLSDLHSNRYLSNGTAKTGPGTANAPNCRPQQREAQFTSQPSHHYSIQVFAIEFGDFAIKFVLFAIEFVTFTIELAPFAIEFVGFATEFIPLAIEFVGFAIEFVGIAVKFVRNKNGSWRKHENMV